MPTLQKVVELNELSSGERKPFLLDGYPALLVRIDDNYYAIEDVCTHDGQPLTDGKVEACEIICPRHGARFDLKTGKAMCMPATSPVETYTVVVKDDGIYVEAP